MGIVFDACRDVGKDGEDGEEERRLLIGSERVIEGAVEGGEEGREGGKADGVE